MQGPSGLPPTHGLGDVSPSVQEEPTKKVLPEQIPGLDGLKELNWKKGEVAEKLEAPPIPLRMPIENPQIGQEVARKAILITLQRAEVPSSTTMGNEWVGPTHFHPAAADDQPDAPYQRLRALLRGEEIPEEEIPSSMSQLGPHVDADEQLRYQKQREEILTKYNEFETEIAEKSKDKAEDKVLKQQILPVGGLIEKEEKELKKPSTASLEILKQGSQAPFQPGMLLGPTIAEATAQFDNVAESIGELAFKRGDAVHIQQKDPSGWWYGEVNGKYGYFPANRVQEK